MSWKKKGFIYCPSGELGWDVDTFMAPHPMVVGDRIRIYGCTRDKDGIGRIKYIEVEGDNPSNVLYVAQEPSLDIGRPGTFDDNGLTLGDIVEVNGEHWMYYVGFQHVQKAKFYAFSGLAISKDGARTFKRYSEVPIMDRTDKGLFGRCIHTVFRENGIFKIYYSLMYGWEYINDIPYPAYNIWYTESEDGIHIPDEDNCLCIDNKGNEYRIGRPNIYKTSDGYEMFYSADLKTKEYVSGYAVSKDGKSWERKDDMFTIPKSENGFDSEMVAYPAKVRFKDRTYIIYNGNGMGRAGIGYAEWIDDE